MDVIPPPVNNRDNLGGGTPTMLAQGESELPPIFQHLSISSPTPPPPSPHPALPSKKLSRSSAIDEETQLINFIRSTMAKSAKDKSVILRIETDLRQFVVGEGSHLPFPSMSSYHRMLVHRISSLFNLDHNIDPLGNCVVVGKNGGQKLPEFRFKELLDEGEGQVNNCRVLRREPHPTEQQQQQQQQQNKTFAQRSHDYTLARSRIFTEESQQIKKIESFDESRYRRGQWRNKGGSSGGGPGWVKASSFGGYNSGPPPLQSSISPASSGYKSLQVTSASTSCSSSQDYFLEAENQHNSPGLPFLPQPQHTCPGQPVQQQFTDPPNPANIIYYIPVTQLQLQQMQMQQLMTGQQGQGVQTGAMMQLQQLQQVQMQPPVPVQQQYYQQVQHGQVQQVQQQYYQPLLPSPQLLLAPPPPPQPAHFHQLPYNHYYNSQIPHPHPRKNAYR